MTTSGRWCAIYQAVAPDATPWLHGDEQIELVNLAQTVPRIVTRLPGIRLKMWLRRDEGYGHADLVLYGVHIVLRRDLTCVLLTWRAGFPWPDGKGMPELAIVNSGKAGTVS